MRNELGRHETWFQVTCIWNHLLKTAAVIGFSFKEQLLGFPLLFLDFHHFHHVIWGMKWAKKLKTKNGQNMSSGPFSHDAAHFMNQQPCKWHFVVVFEGINLILMWQAGYCILKITMKKLKGKTRPLINLFQFCSWVKWIDLGIIRDIVIIITKTETKSKLLFSDMEV